MRARHKSQAGSATPQHRCVRAHRNKYQSRDENSRIVRGPWQWGLSMQWDVRCEGVSTWSGGGAEELGRASNGEEV